MKTFVKYPFSCELRAFSDDQKSDFDAPVGSKIQKKVCASITPPKKLTDNLIKISKSDFILLNSYSIVVFFLVQPTPFDSNLVKEGHFVSTRLFSSRTLVAKALKVLMMSGTYSFFLPIFFIFQNLIFQIIPSNPVKLFFKKNPSFQIYLA